MSQQFIEMTTEIGQWKRSVRELTECIEVKSAAHLDQLLNQRGLSGPTSYMHLYTEDVAYFLGTDNNIYTRELTDAGDETGDMTLFQPAALFIQDLVET